MRERFDEYKGQIILALILIILIIVALIVYGINKNTTTHFISTLLVEKDGIEYEVKVRKFDKITFFREGDVETVISKIPREGKERLEIPNLRSIKAENTVKGRLPMSELTWELTYSDSFKYIKYLIEEEGYKIEMYASTPQFVELFLIKDNLYKRVVVFRDIIMIGDMYEGTQLPNIETYFKGYSIFDKNKVE